MTDSMCLNSRQYAGPADLEEMAATVLKSTGPSGRNRDYLYNLAEAMRQLAPSYGDSHLYELEEAVKRLETMESEGSC